MRGNMNMDVTPKTFLLVSSTSYYAPINVNPEGGGGVGQRGGFDQSGGPMGRDLD